MNWFETTPQWEGAAWSIGLPSSPINEPQHTYYKYITLPPIQAPTPRPSKIPHKCPVCIGRGHMPYNFYQDIKTIVTTDPVKCRSCKGKGIVWETQDI